LWAVEVALGLLCGQTIGDCVGNNWICCFCVFLPSWERGGNVGVDC